MKKKVRRRYTSDGRLTREQAFWLCRAVLAHYKQDPQADDSLFNTNGVASRSHKSNKYKRGRDWVIHPVGYDLDEMWYGTDKTGIREAQASLVSMPISRTILVPEEYRTYTTYGLVNENKMNIAVYHITEVTATSMDEGFLKYVMDCFSRLQEDAKESPEYDPKHV